MLPKPKRVVSIPGLHSMVVNEHDNNDEKELCIDPKTALLVDAVPDAYLAELNVVLLAKFSGFLGKLPQLRRCWQGSKSLTGYR